VEGLGVNKHFLIFVLFNVLQTIGADKKPMSPGPMSPSRRESLSQTVEKNSLTKCLKDPSKIHLAVECVNDCSEDNLQGSSAELTELTNVINRSQFLLEKSYKKFIKNLLAQEQQIIADRRKNFLIVVKVLRALGRPEEVISDSDEQELP
jgi:hypothetical protein